MIVFTSDNGPGPLTAQVKSRSVIKRYRERPSLLNSVGSAGDYRDRKLSVHDGGIHVPFIVKWPSQIPAGKVDQETVISSVDWLPTMASLSGADIPTSYAYDGIDMSEAIKGKPQKRVTPLFWYDSNGNSAILQHHWKGVPSNDGFLLFDLDHDSSESKNLALVNPTLANELSETLEAWKAKVPKPRERKVRKRK